MKTKLTKVTPELAAEWLKKNDNNRPLSRAAVETHKRNLIAKNFRTTHQGIALDSKGRLRDGQHRLLAIVESGVAATMLVTEGLSDSDLQAIDDGRKRTAKDILSMAYKEPVSAYTTALAREMYIGGWHLAEGVKRRLPSRQELVDFFGEHSEAIEYASNKLKLQTSGLRMSFIGAVIARAFTHLSERKLSQFARTLVTGMGGEEMELVIRLRNHILRTLRDGARGAVTRDEIYGKTQSVLQAWNAGTTMAHLRSATTELFPLAKEEPRVAAKAADA